MSHRVIIKWRNLIRVGKCGRDRWRTPTTPKIHTYGRCAYGRKVTSPMSLLKGKRESSSKSLLVDYFPFNYSYSSNDSVYLNNCKFPLVSPYVFDMRKSIPSLLYSYICRENSPSFTPNPSYLPGVSGFTLTFTKRNLRLTRTLRL